MRVFWFIIGLLACGAVTFWRVSSKPAATPASAESLAVSLADPASDQGPAKPVKSEPPASVEPKADSLTAASVATPEVKPDAAPAAIPATVSTVASTPKSEEKPAAPAADAPTAKVTRNADGSLLIDDRFTVKGAGTAESPYHLSWELLTSISESYDPRVGKKKLPDRLTMFDGKVVRITGYVAYPMFVEQPRELLSMLNQWDGCCIGVPPTPYDAIEVHLKETVTKEQRLASYGAVEGKFSVKPYLAGDWLVGLYILDDAKVSDTKANGQGS